MHNFQEPEQPDLRSGRGGWEEATNRQQRKIVKTYDQWGVAVRRDLNAAIKAGKTEAELQAIIDRHIPALERSMLDVIDEGTKRAAAVSAGDKVTNPKVIARIQKGLQQNRELVQGALIPAMKERLGRKIAGTMGKQAIKGAFDGLKGMPAQYAGGYWTMIFEVQRDLGFDRERERGTEGLPPEQIRWVLDKSAEHCVSDGGYYGCVTLAGVYPSWGALKTVPAGQTSCRGNCRCHLEVYRDGTWQRGVY
uniref:Uncharacterized protein n=1 Tax=viral metagenome TaxID=1070528 RepID=A0A6M3JVV0_9ZZZZ